MKIKRKDLPPEKEFSLESEDQIIYMNTPDAHYSEKPDHLERSIANDPRPRGHRKHKKKNGSKK